MKYALIKYVLLPLMLLCILPFTRSLDVVAYAVQEHRSGTIRFRDVSTGKEIRVLSDDYDITSLAFNPSGTILAGSSIDRTVKLWSTDTGKLIKTLKGHSGPVQSVAFSPDGKTLASGSWDHTVRLWDVNTGREIMTLSENQEEVFSVGFSPDGRTLASGGGDQTIRIWDTSSGKVLRSLAVEQSRRASSTDQSPRITSVAFSNDGKLLAAGSEDNTIRIWTVSTGALSSVLIGHSDIVESVAFNDNGSRLASGSRDQTVRIWDVTRGNVLQTLQGHYSTVNHVAFAPGGKIIASGSYDRTVKLWDADTGAELDTFEGYDQQISCVAFSPDGRTLVTGSGRSLDESPSLHVISIGISHYIGDAPSLDFAAKDARDFAARIEKIGKTKFARVRVHTLFDYSANQSLIASVFKKVIRESKPQDTFILFYSGAALAFEDTDLAPDERRRLTLLASDSNYIKESLIRSWLDKIEAQRQLIILETRDRDETYKHFLKRISKEEKGLKGLLLRDTVIVANAVYGNPPTYNRNGFLTDSLLEALDGRIASPHGEVTAKRLIEHIEERQSAMPRERLLRSGEIKTYATGDDFSLGYVDGSRSRSDKDDVGVERQALTAGMLNGIDLNLSFIDRASESKATIRFIRQDEGRETSATSQSTSPPLTRKGKPYALLFATDVYDHWPKLTNPINDAKTIADELKTSYGFAVEVIENPTRTEIREKLKEYLKRHYEPDDQLFIFFAGHGAFLDDITSGCIISKETQRDYLDVDSCLTYPILNRIINNIPCNHILLVIDACFGGTFDEAIARRGADNPYRDATKSEFIERKMRFKTRRYLTSGGKEYVGDGQPGRHSPFARKFLEALRSYGGDDAILTLNELQIYIEKVIPPPYSGEWGSNEPGSDFIFIARQPD